jgi:hypothetical protein
MGRCGWHHAQQPIHDGAGSGGSHYRLPGPWAPLPLWHGVPGQGALVSNSDPDTARALMAVLQLQAGEDYLPGLRADAGAPGRRVVVEVTQG